MPPPVAARIMARTTLDIDTPLLDAHLAALLLQHDVRVLYTNDRDFRKFDFLETRNPFDT
jgi:predicted nucleic acid-binding protein